MVLMFVVGVFYSIWCSLQNLEPLVRELEFCGSIELCYILTDYILVL